VKKLRLASRRDSGATAVEYALMVTFIAMAVVAAVTLLGLNVNGLFQLMPPGL
jgi:Flp pilus assembly pilin Flp